LHLALKTAQRIFQRLTLLYADFCQLDFTVLPVHVATMTINHDCYERSTRYRTAYWETLLADPPSEVKHCFRVDGLFGTGGIKVSGVWDFPAYLLE
jgi:hypothetical protein